MVIKIAEKLLKYTININILKSTANHTYCQNLQEYLIFVLQLNQKILHMSEKGQN